MNLTPPATIDDQPVLTFAFQSGPSPHHIGDSWPKGSKGNCLCIQPVATNGVFPNEVDFTAAQGGVGNTWCVAVVTDFDQPIVWTPGAVAHLPGSDCRVLGRNCDLTGGQHPVHFPPKHPPTRDTDTSVKVYRNT